MKIVAALVLTLTLLPRLEVKRKSDLQYDGLAGRVRTIREYRFHETKEIPDYKAGRFEKWKEAPYLTSSYNEEGDMDGGTLSIWPRPRSSIAMVPKEIES